MTTEHEHAEPVAILASDWRPDHHQREPILPPIPRERVAEMIRAAVLEEREACAQIAAQHACPIAARIRSRP